MKNNFFKFSLLFVLLVALTGCPNLPDSTENNENGVTQNKKTSLSMFTVKPLPEGAYIDKVPVEGGVPGDGGEMQADFHGGI